jgi:hypothetical protein
VPVNGERYENRIVWVINPDTMPYVRESTVIRPQRSGRVALHSFKVVGWAELQPDAPRFCGGFWRRVFWLKSYDRYFEPDGTYATDRPCEAVDPRLIRAGSATR